MRIEHKSKKTAGFTLIELMVVVGIMVAVFAFSIPAFQGIGEGSAMKTSIERLRVTISLARQHAIMKRENVFVIFSGSTGSGTTVEPYRSFSVYGADSGYISNWKTLPSGVVFLGENAPNNIYQDSTLDFPFPEDGKPDAPLHYIQFKPDGTGAGGSGGKEIYVAEGFYDTQLRSTSSNPWYPRRSVQVLGYTGLSRINEDNG